MTVAAESMVLEEETLSQMAVFEAEKVQARLHRTLQGCIAPVEEVSSLEEVISACGQ